MRHINVLFHDMVSSFRENAHLPSSFPPASGRADANCPGFSDNRTPVPVHKAEKRVANAARQRLIHFIEASHTRLSSFYRKPWSKTESPDARHRDLHNSQWDPLPPRLVPFARARMHNGVAKKEYLDEQADDVGGICHGSSSVWHYLKHASPHAASSARMRVMMMPESVQHAITAQRHYVRQSWHGQATVEPAYPEEDFRVHAQTYKAHHSNMFGAAIETFDADSYCDDREYEQLGKKLAFNKGAYTTTLTMECITQSTGLHALDIVSQGHGRSLTVFDSNIGELRVPAAKFSEFMKGMADFYLNTRGHKIQGIRGVQKITFPKDLQISAPADLRPLVSHLKFSPYLK